MKIYFKLDKIEIINDTPKGRDDILQGISGNMFPDKSFRKMRRYLNKQHYHQHQ